jgi:diadenylate cyclase
MLLLGPVAIVILFYPELRHALEEVGRVGFWGKNFTGLQKEDVTDMIDELVRAASFLSDKRIGALVVLERETGLTDIIETGTTVNGAVSAELVETLFFPGSPLHDGAVVVRGGRVVAAGCTLPLSESRNSGGTVHTRHKAAIGMSEQSDALVIVVSEESGIVSLAFSGRMIRGIRDDALKDRLVDEYTGRDRHSRRRRGSLAGVRSLTTTIAPFLSSRGDKGRRPGPPAATSGPDAPPIGERLDDIAGLDGQPGVDPEDSVGADRLPR